jgi:Tol biopolymer transport system component
MLWSDGLRVSTIAAALLLASLVAALFLWVERPAEATFPGTNGKIVFDSNRVTTDNPTGDSEIFTVNDGNSGLAQLTNNPANDTSAAWAPIPTPPKQQKIVFASKRDGDYEIYMMNAEPESATNVPVQLTNNTARDTNPTWSPDGTKIAFMSDRGLNSNEDIYVMNAVDSNVDHNGDNLRRLTKNVASDDRPAWSPGGGKIAFQSERGSAGASGVYVMKPRPEGRKNRPRNLTKDLAFAIAPNWSPDGTSIVFEGSQDLNGIDEIYTMKADGTGKTRLTDNNVADADPVWSPDGLKIAFERFVGGDDYDIYVMKAAPVSSTNVATSLASNSAGDFDPDWQPIP